VQMGTGFHEVRGKGMPQRVNGRCRQAEVLTRHDNEPLQGTHRHRRRRRVHPGFQISPHRLSGIAGIVGACLLLVSLLWCLFVPRTIAVNTQWSNTPKPASSEPLRTMHQNEDGSFKEFNSTEAPRRDNQAQQGASGQPATTPRVGD
jgi:hypothetical protein